MLGKDDLFASSSLCIRSSIYMPLGHKSIEIGSQRHVTKFSTRKIYAEKRIFKALSFLFERKLDTKPACIKMSVRATFNS